MASTDIVADALCGREALAATGGKDECDATSAQGIGPCLLGGPEAVVTSARSGDLADLPVTMSWFKDERDTVPVREDMTWADLVERLSKHDVRVGKEGPGFSPVLYKRGATRGTIGVEQLYCAVADVDSGITPDRFLETFPPDLAVLFVSTHRSPPEKPKFRAVTPLAMPCGGADWPAVWPRIQEHVWGGASDPQTKDAGRFYYTPSHTLGAVPIVRYRAGRALDWRALPPATAARTRGAPSDAAASDGWARLDYEQFVDGVSEGGRNEAIFRLTCSLIEKRLDADAAWTFVRLAAQNCEPPLDESETEVTFDRAWRRYDPSPPAISVIEDDDEVVDQTSSEVREPYRFVDVSELDDEPDYDWIVPGVLAPTLLTILGGQAKDGKSTWMASLMGSIERGEPWMDLETRQIGGVVLLTEEPAPSLKEKGARFGWQAGRTSIMHRGTVGVTPDIAAAVARAIAEAERIGAEVLFVDSLMFWGGVGEAGGENDSATMQKVMNQLVHAAGRGLAVGVLHHSSKDGEALRGSGAIAANADIILTLKRAPGTGGTRRVLNGVGRSDKVPHNLTIELDGNEYHAVGAQGASVTEHRRVTAATIVLGADRPLTLADIVEDWPVNANAPDDRALGRIVKTLVDRELFAQVGKGVRGDPFAYEASPTAREMAAAILELLGSIEAYAPEASDIAERLDRDVADVRLVLRGLAARGRVTQEGHGAEAVYRRSDDGDAAVLHPALERELRDLMGSDAEHPTREEESQALAALMAAPSTLPVAEVARASCLSEERAGAALQALAERGAIQRTETAGGPVFGMWF